MPLGASGDACTAGVVLGRGCTDTYASHHPPLGIAVTCALMSLIRHASNPAVSKMIGLFFFVGFNVVCLFIDISHAEQIACSCSLIIFTLLTALDMKKLKHFYFEYQEDEVRLAQLSMYSALQLYLDFLNLIYTITHILNGFEKK